MPPKLSKIGCAAAASVVMCTIACGEDLPLELATIDPGSSYRSHERRPRASSSDNGNLRAVRVKSLLIPQTAGEMSL